MNRVMTQLGRRPRVYSLLHAMRLVEPVSEMTRGELDCLEDHARGHRVAIEIGTQMGKSASRIARAIDPAGRLFCVDPWQNSRDGEHPCLRITKRELARRGVYSRVTLVIAKSREAGDRLPDVVDFMFVDGDHSYDGLATDWAIVASRLIVGGTVCLHDTSVTASEPWRAHGSVTYFDEVIKRDRRFQQVERCHTLNVLRRMA